MYWGFKKCILIVQVKGGKAKEKYTRVISQEKPGTVTPASSVSSLQTCLCQDLTKAQRRRIQTNDQGVGMLTCTIERSGKKLSGEGPAKNF